MSPSEQLVLFTINQRTTIINCRIVPSYNDLTPCHLYTLLQDVLNKGINSIRVRWAYFGPTGSGMT